MNTLTPIVEHLDELSGSQIKVLLAIYSEGKWLTTSELMILTGLTRKTVYLAMNHPKTKELIGKLNNKTDDQKLLQWLKSQIKTLES